MTKEQASAVCVAANYILGNVDFGPGGSGEDLMTVVPTPSGFEVIVDHEDGAQVCRTTEQVMTLVTSLVATRLRSTMEAWYEMNADVHDNY